ncbi:MAG TPA: response regulator transcription factor [Lachnospiraceae bacterium]|nr:response regulator transcription factor [Lachnospiraceae bacterium]
MDSNAHILVVEDDVDINNLITTILRKNGYQVTSAYSGSEAELRIRMEEFDLLILDLMLPGMTGEEIIAKTRESKEMPIIVISAKITLEDRVQALNIGADDYITKPFEIEEILARVNSQLRRYHKFSNVDRRDEESIEEDCFQFKNLTMNVTAREALVNGNPISLTVHEYEILLLLIKNPNKVYSRESLYESIWDNGYYGEDNTVNVHISNIRKKLDAVDKDTEYIKTVWGIGFKLAK